MVNQSEERVYLFGFPRPILKIDVRAFMESWKQHKLHIAADWKIYHEQILLVIETKEQPFRGCAVDELYRWAKERGWIRERIFYFDDVCLRSISWKELPKQFKIKQITEETEILDLSLHKKFAWVKNPSFIQKFCESSYYHLIAQTV